MAAGTRIRISMSSSEIQPPKNQLARQPGLVAGHRRQLTRRRKDGRHQLGWLKDGLRDERGEDLRHKGVIGGVSCFLEKCRQLNNRPQRRPLTFCAKSLRNTCQKVTRRRQPKRVYKNKQAEESAGPCEERGPVIANHFPTQKVITSIKSCSVTVYNQLYLWIATFDLPFFTLGLSKALSGRVTPYAHVHKTTGWVISYSMSIIVSQSESRHSCCQRRLTILLSFLWFIETLK